MDIEMTVEQMEQDFEYMAKEHDIAAENEYIWAHWQQTAGAETTKMHLENMEQHKRLAKMYRRMKRDCCAFIEEYYVIDQ